MILISLQAIESSVDESVSSFSVARIETLGKSADEGSISFRHKTIFRQKFREASSAEWSQRSPHLQKYQPASVHLRRSRRNGY